MHLKRMLLITIKRLTVIILLGFVAVLIFYISSFGVSNHKASNAFISGEKDEIGKLKKFALQAKNYCQQKRFNSNVCFLVDMSLPSGKNRFFQYDLNGDSIITSGIVAHGSCNEQFLDKPRFSDEKGCGCTSIGKYKVGYKYKGKFGEAYKLYGLDSTNNNAFSRNIVLHSYYLIPEKETFPLPVCNSLGCAMISKAYFKLLSQNIDDSMKPILLWIF